MILEFYTKMQKQRKSEWTCLLTEITASGTLNVSCSSGGPEMNLGRGKKKKKSNLLNSHNWPR